MMASPSLTYVIAKPQWAGSLLTWANETSSIWEWAVFFGASAKHFGSNGLSGDISDP